MPIWNRKKDEAQPIEIPDGPNVYRLTTGNIVMVGADGLTVRNPSGHTVAMIDAREIDEVFRDDLDELTMRLQAGNNVSFDADPETSGALEAALIELQDAAQQREAAIEQQRFASAKEAGGVMVHDDGRIDISVDSVPGAKLAIKHLRLKKREYAAEKKEVQAEITEIRSGRRTQVAKQGSIVRGGGKFGQVVRTGQRAGRDRDRVQYTNQLQPYEQAKATIDHKVLQIDLAITKLEKYILDQGG